MSVFLTLKLLSNSLQKTRNYSYILSFSKILLVKIGPELVIGMGNENYEMIDKLESIAKSLESMAESQKRIVDILELLAQEKGIMDLET